MFFRKLAQALSSSRTSKISRERGFTLIEVLGAIIVGAIIFAFAAFAIQRLFRFKSFRFSLSLRGSAGAVAIRSKQITLFSSASFAAYSSACRRCSQFRCVINSTSDIFIVLLFIGSP